MIYHINGSCVSNIGNVRNNNEDNFFFDGKYLEENNNGLSDVITIKFLNKEKVKEIIKLSMIPMIIFYIIV